MHVAARGLPGEKSGGTALCRIGTVIDNLGRLADPSGSVPWHAGNAPRREAWNSDP
jgi:hypothetical protein